jgi:RNA polymerase sigma-54 factor
MTPQLMQAIKLLQLSSLDLAAYVEGELERNPLLERAVEEDDRQAVTAEPEAPTAEADGADWIGSEFETSRGAMEASLGTELENVFPDDGAAAPAPVEAPPPAYSEWTGNGPSGEDYNPEAFVSAETTLGDHLAAQLALALTDPARRMIGQYLIDMVDEAGYLAGDLAAVGEKLGAPVGEVEAVLAVLQSFDPAGVCARNLTECLAIQLKERDRFDPAMQALLAHLDLLAKRDIAALRRVCGVGDEDIADMIGEIRALNPKPGLAFGSTTVQPIDGVLSTSVVIPADTKASTFEVTLVCRNGSRASATVTIINAQASAPATMGPNTGGGFLANGGNGASTMTSGPFIWIAVGLGSIVAAIVVNVRNRRAARRVKVNQR